MNKITPGPWSIYFLANDVETYGVNANLPIITADDDDTEVCGVIGNPADAHMISAAPDLLNALRALLGEVQDDSLDCVKQAKAAIAKAEGKEGQA